MQKKRNAPNNIGQSLLNVENLCDLRQRCFAHNVKTPLMINLYHMCILSENIFSAGKILTYPMSLPRPTGIKEIYKAT